MQNYKKRNRGGSQPSIAAPGGLCQSELINPDYSHVRDEIACPYKTKCITETGAPVKSKKKARFTKWTKKSIYEKYKGTCKDPSARKSLVSRVWKETKNKVKGSVTTAARMPSLAKLCGFIPNQPETDGLKFSKNIWRNLKRNMVVLAAIPTEELKSQFLPEDSEQLKDYQNLMERMKKYNVNLNPSNYDHPEEDDDNHPNNNKNNNNKNNNVVGGKRTLNKRKKNKHRTKKL